MMIPPKSTNTKSILKLDFHLEKNYEWEVATFSLLSVRGQCIFRWNSSPVRHWIVSNYSCSFNKEFFLLQNIEHVSQSFVAPCVETKLLTDTFTVSPFPCTIVPTTIAKYSIRNQSTECIIKGEKRLRPQGGSPPIRPERSKVPAESDTSAQGQLLNASISTLGS